jgi:hypothetical protein
MVIAYNVLNNVEVDYRAKVCAHIESLVGRDLILAIVAPIKHQGDLMTTWINRFPQLKLSYSAVGYPEHTVSLVDQKPVTFVTLFAWLYRAPAEVIPVEPRIRVKKKGT